ncbi:MAG: bacteriorhodopsin-like [Cytophagales bacterium]|nr:bacteriorhodopsin-like [Bernardetiaceae bacterium]MDW8210008.1 bacteriorhodopsin-like [Cytophagales bacterium]
MFTSVLLDATLQTGDYIGFTFFTGYMSMLAASIFFIVERGTVAEKWKTSLLVSALITFIAAVHYFYMRGVWLEKQISPTQFRYIDWTLTVPLMCVEYYLILKPAGASAGMLVRLILASLLMLVAGYIGEAVDMSNNILWGVISTVGWAVIIYEIYFGEAAKLAKASNNPIVQKGYNVLRWFTLVGWAIYPIGYMMLPGNLLHGLVEGHDFSKSSPVDLAYNIADAINKIGFGLVIYSIAKGATAEEKTMTVARA